MNNIQNLKAKINWINKDTLTVILFGIIYLIWNYTVFIRSGGAQGLFDAGFLTLDA